MFKILESIPERALIDAFGPPTQPQPHTPIVVRLRLNPALKTTAERGLNHDMPSYRSHRTSSH